MPPAFSTLRAAVAFAALLFALIAAPAVVGRMNLLDRSELYRTMPTSTGPASHIQQQIFEDSADLDVVFIGSSLMWSGIDAPHVQRELSAMLGREATVSVLANVWPGLDRDYALLKDLLSQRRVRLVVLQFPNRNRPTRDPAAEINRVSDQPHVQAFRFYRAGDFDEANVDLAWRHRAALYAGAVLGLPRHLLTLLRPNYTTLSPTESDLGARFQRLGFYGAPFERFRPNAPAIGADEMIYNETTASAFGFFDEPLPPYQMHFAKLIASLLNDYEVPAVLLHIPQANEISAELVEERMYWIDETGVPATMMGIPPARLFEGFTENEAERFFLNDHLNENGAAYFTRVFTPALLKIYNQQ